MKKSFPITILFLFPIIICSCNNSNRADSLVIEDYFEVPGLIPNNNVKKAIGKNVLSCISGRFDYDIDTVCAQVECNAIWNVSECTDPSSIKVIEIDTSWFYLTINKGKTTESIMNWSCLADRPILQYIKKILDTGTYSLYCVNYNDVSPQSLLNNYIDSVAKTEISFKVFLSNNTE